jgi:hypothetical protein
VSGATCARPGCGNDVVRVPGRRGRPRSTARRAAVPPSPPAASAAESSSRSSTWPMPTKPARSPAASGSCASAAVGEAPSSPETSDASAPPLSPASCAPSSSRPGTGSARSSRHPPARRARELLDGEGRELGDGRHLSTAWSPKSPPLKEKIEEGSNSSALCTPKPISSGAESSPPTIRDVVGDVTDREVRVGIGDDHAHLGARVELAWPSGQR